MRISHDGGSSGRPTNWWILGLSSDPTPGDPMTAVVLSGQMSGVADGAFEAHRGVLSLLSDPAITGWEGASGEAFRTACSPFPDQLDTMRASFQDAADALTAFNTAASSAQGMADSSLSSAHYAAQKVGLRDDELHNVSGFDGAGYANAIKQVLLAKQSAAQPSPASEPQSASPTASDPDRLQEPYQTAL